MDYTHTFEIQVTQGEHTHLWQGEISFDHGTDVHTKYAEGTEFCEESAAHINGMFREIKNLAKQCGLPDKIEIKLKT